jgi:hypothetical protein
MLQLPTLFFCGGKMPKTTANTKTSFAYIYNCVTTAFFYTACGFSDPVVVAFYLQVFWGYFSPINCSSDDCTLSPSSKVLMGICSGTATLMLCKALLELYCIRHNEQLKTTKLELDKLQKNLIEAKNNLQAMNFQLALISSVPDSKQEFLIINAVLNKLGFSSENNNSSSNLDYEELDNSDDNDSEATSDNNNFQPSSVNNDFKPSAAYDAYFLLNWFNRYQILVTAFNSFTVLPLMNNDLFITTPQDQHLRYTACTFSFSLAAAILLRWIDIRKDSSQAEDRNKLEEEIYFLDMKLGKWIDQLDLLHAKLTEKVEGLSSTEQPNDNNLAWARSQLTRVKKSLSSLIERNFFKEITIRQIKSDPDEHILEDDADADADADADEKTKLLN